MNISESLASPCTLERISGIGLPPNRVGIQKRKRREKEKERRERGEISSYLHTQNNSPFSGSLVDSM